MDERYEEQAQSMLNSIATTADSLLDEYEHIVKVNVCAALFVPDGFTITVE